ncbi:MAG TPA: sensor histidine kinase, partial [Actinocrinis sp.]
MNAWRRFAGGDPDAVRDTGSAVAGAVLTALAAWMPTGVIGAPVTGPLWLRVLLPPLVGAPLLLRRRAPLLMWAAILVVVAVQYAVTRHLPEGFEWFVPLAGAYSLGVFVSLRRSAAALVVGMAMILAARTGFSLIPLVLCWLVGVLVRAGSEHRALTRRNAELEHQAEQAKAAERARIARELHDIVAHHLSVVVLQAAGARASGSPADAALEKIERSGRQALIETRRLLDVLRDTDLETELAPQPGIGELDSLTASVRAAGLPVRLVVEGDRSAVPAAVDVSVYRIVQEALTNVLKHAGPARADVTIGCAAEAVTVEITDNGTGELRDRTLAGGHGLAGMRERAAVFGGELAAGPGPGG